MPFYTGSDRRTILLVFMPLPLGGFAAPVPIFLDSVRVANHKSNVAYTRFPTETGEQATNNALTLPEELEMQFIISDTPTNVNLGGSYEGRHKLIYSLLVTGQRLKAKVVVITGLRSHLNMYIESLEAVKTKDTGKAIEINIKFVEVKEVGTSLLTLAASLALSSDIVHGIAGAGGVKLGLL